MPTWRRVVTSVRAQRDDGEGQPESDPEALENMLEAQRIGLIRKVEGVSDELARQAPTASSLSLLGLVGDIPAMAAVALNAPHHRSPGRANALTCRRE